MPSLTLFRPFVLALAALCVAAACRPATAREPVQMSIVDRDSGDWLPQYRHRGEDWIAGVPGHRYGVRLTNTSARRVLVVLSVDGINAVSGQTASVAQAGYVLAPWETAEIDGWRKSLDEVAQFVFTDLGDSYAARTGRPRNVGVIGIAVFEEARPAYNPPPLWRREAGAAARQAAPAAVESASADASAARQRIGTGHGQREWSPVGTTDFERASTAPAQVVTIRYDDTSRLVALGILPHPHRHLHGDAPRAFPEGFVADPPGWD